MLGNVQGTTKRPVFPEQLVGVEGTVGEVREAKRRRDLQIM